MNLLVLTGYDAAMAPVGDLTNPSKEAYARRHGYSFLCNRAYTPDTHPSWQKIRLLQDLLPAFDAILWLDADTLVTNPDFDAVSLFTYFGCPISGWSPVVMGRFEKIGKVSAHMGLVVSDDWSTCQAEDEIHHFSMGNFAITNCRESFRLLELMSRRTHWANQSLWEQQAIQEIHRESDEIHPLIRRLPRRYLNSVPFHDAPEPWQPGDFVCHFTGIANEIRIQEIERVQSLLTSDR